jgi:hypothetical protein
LSNLVRASPLETELIAIYSKLPVPPSNPLANTVPVPTPPVHPEVTLNVTGGRVVVVVVGATVVVVVGAAVVVVVAAVVVVVVGAAVVVVVGAAVVVVVGAAVVVVVAAVVVVVVGAAVVVVVGPAVVVVVGGGQEAVLQFPTGVIVPVPDTISTCNNPPTTAAQIYFFPAVAYT